MKTIRQNVFETNSSSTHSVTITRKSNPSVKADSKPLVDKQVLYPMRLSQFSTSFGYEGSNTSCDTYDKKAAIVAQWILSKFSDEELEEVDYKVYIAYLREKLGYLAIDFEGQKWASYSPYDDNGNVFSLSGDEDEDYQVLDEAILNITNDDIVISDTDAPW